MIRINLLPFRAARKQENIKNQVVMFLLSLLLVLCVLFLLHSVLGRRVTTLTAEIKNTQNELARVEAMAKEVTTIKDHLGKVKERLDVIQTLKGDRAAPVHLLDDLTKWVVERSMWITSMESEATKVTFRGIAVDNKTVATFMRRLEDSGQFISVDLLTVQRSLQENEASSNLKQFDVICLKPGALEEQEEKDAKAGKGEKGNKPKEGAKPDKEAKPENPEKGDKAAKGGGS